jgi:hypothetical protein
VALLHLTSNTNPMFEWKSAAAAEQLIYQRPFNINLIGEVAIWPRRRILILCMLLMFLCHIVLNQQPTVGGIYFVVQEIYMLKKF